jgi:hypothetical protein
MKFEKIEVLVVRTAAFLVFVAIVCHAASREIANLLMH